MRKLVRFFKPLTGIIVTVIVLVLLESLGELKLPDLMSEIVDEGIAKGDISLIWRMGGWMLLVALASTAAQIVANYLSARASSAVGRDMRDELFSHVEEFSLHEFNQIGTASLITRTTNDVQQIQNVFLMILRMVARAPMMAIGGVFMALRKDAQLATMLLTVLPLLGVAIFLVARMGIPLFKQIQRKLDNLNRVLREQLTGVRVIRAFDRVRFEEQRFNQANRDLTATALKVNRIMALLMPLLMLIMNYSAIAIVWFGGHQIDAGRMQVGDLMAFIQYAMQIMMSLVAMSMIFVMLPRASASAERINEVFDTKPEIVDPENPITPSSGQGVVEFDHVTFSYPGAEKPVLADISFCAHPGEFTAVIGSTGSGKSTLLNLIPRFYDLQSGSIKINGVDIRHMSLKNLRGMIGYVPQKASLFSGTIASNVRSGKKDAALEEVRAAAEVAQASEFIEEKEEGYDSFIAQGGTNVSGGQKQRLSIARAVVRQPEIYLLDDTFSALDYKTDAKLRAAFRKMAQHAAVIVVAQRVSTILHADRILVLDKGRIVGQGTHQELVKSCQVYQEIVASQLSEEELA